MDIYDAGEGILICSKAGIAFRFSKDTEKKTCLHKLPIEAFHASNGTCPVCSLIQMKKQKQERGPSLDELREELLPSILAANLGKITELAQSGDYEALETLLLEILAAQNSLYEIVDRTRSLARIADAQIRLSLKEKFETVPPQLYTEVRALPSWGHDQYGVFAIGTIPKGTVVGRYAGVVIEAMDHPSFGPRGTSYLFSIEYFRDETRGFVYGEITIDGSRSYDQEGNIVDTPTWTGRINHKWSWDTVLRLASLNAGRRITMEMPTGWRLLFANTKIAHPSGNIIALRDIDKDEQLFFDYGERYWKKDEVPFWDISVAPEDLLHLMNTPPDTEQLFFIRAALFDLLHKSRH